GDGRINLSEVLRLIQFFNSGGFSCAVPPESSEDGYEPGAGDTGCAMHNADYNPQDWAISLSELLRVIQFFNLGGYISVTPMRADLTAHDAMDVMKGIE
ncbi:MAG: hypothetical protein ACPG61_14490, partial [Paracoccaceae bacterium]